MSGQSPSAQLNVVKTLNSLSTANISTQAQLIPAKLQVPQKLERLKDAQKSEPKTSRSVFVSMATGWVSGAVGIAATHPIDCVRVTKQYQARIHSNNFPYSQIIRQIREKYGFGGFYRGVIPPTVLRGCGLAANRSGFNFGKKFFRGEKIEGTWRMWIVGGFAGVCTGIVEMPIHLLKCRAQVKAGFANETFMTYAVMLQRIWKYEGLSAFINGLTPQIACSFLSFSLFYALYDCLTASGLPVFLAGMTCGVVSWVPIIPLDSMRVRMQCQPYYVQLRTVVRDMWRQPVTHWFAGMGATALRAAPRWGVTMVLLESCNKVVNLYS